MDPASPTPVPEYCETFERVWRHANPGAGLDGTVFTPAEQSRHEAKLSALVDTLTEEASRARRVRAHSSDIQRRMLANFADFACGSLGWDPQLFEDRSIAEFAGALRAFPALARDFDPTLAPAEIYQAARNVVTMHCLQRLLGIPVRPTASTLAYSLLYPYTDNFLDDERVSEADKIAFGRRLADRLAGVPVVPVGSREARIFSLVGLIEQEHDRTARPDVFGALLAIHHAQQESLNLLRTGDELSAADILRISVEKGGHSVLADGYLVNGTLTREQAECIYGLGVFLQLRDDLEDVFDDRAHHQRTVYSAAIGRQTLDEPTARTLAIGQAVLHRLSCFPAASAGPLRDVVWRSLKLTVADAAASVAGSYSPAYLSDLERHSPVRLDYLVRQRQRVARANGSFTSLLQFWLAESDETEPGREVATALPIRV